MTANRRLDDILSQSSILSFDVFDTTVVRKVMFPNHLHWAVGRVLRKSNLTSESDAAWRKIRIDSESVARSLRPDGEVSINEIFDHISSIVGFDEDAKRRAIQIELETEYSLLYGVRDILTRLYENSKRKKIIFISDMYLGSENIASMLKKFDISGFEIYCSSDVGLDKRSGKIFPYIEKQMDHNGPICHIGDNLIADVMMPRRAGLRSFHFDQVNPTRYETILWESGHDDYLSSIIAGSARVARLSHCSRTPLESALWRVSTGVAGPILTAFTMWIVMDAQKRGLTKLFFLARDGEILQKLAVVICHHLKIDMECIYMHASRQALFLPSLPAEIADAMAEIRAKSEDKTVRRLLLELEFPVDRIAHLLASSKYGPDDMISDDIWESVLLPEIKEHVSAIVMKRKRAFSAYAQKIGLFSDRDFGIVDLGWRGRLQLSMEKNIPNEFKKPHGYYFNLISRPEQTADRVHLFSPESAFSADVLETFCMATHATICKYDYSSDGHPTGVEASERVDGPKLWTVSEFQDGIIKYAETLLTDFGKFEVNLDEFNDRLKTSAISAMRKFIRYPDPNEAEAIGSVVHTGDQTHLYQIELAPRIKLKMLRAFIAKKSGHGTFLAWRHGMLMRTTPYQIYLFFFLLMHTKSILKKSLTKRFNELWLIIQQSG